MIELQDWVSAFFQQRVGRLAKFRPDKHAALRTALQSFDLVEAKVDQARTAEIDDLVELGFRYVAGEAEFSLNAERWRPNYGYGTWTLAETPDIHRLRDIASASFSATRFRTPYFRADLVAEMYALWVEKAVRGEFDHWCLIARRGHEIEGFVTLRTIDGRHHRIGLLAVEEGSKSRGVGTQLVRSACNFALSRDAEATILVATQTANCRAQNLYMKLGFRLMTVSAWLYHTTARAHKK